MSVRNAQGEQVTQGTKQPDIPNAPTIGTSSDVGTNRAYNDGAATVTFTPTGYWDSTFTATSTPGSLTATGTSSPLTVTGLSSATTYTFSVKSNNGAGISSVASGATANTTATTVPQAPTIGTFTDGGTGTSGTLSFTAGNSGGKTITDYKYSTDNITYTSAGSTTSPLTVSGLSVGNYTFYLKAVNANGDSAASAGVAGTVIQPNNFESIATVTGTGSSATLTFNSIPSGYKSLQIRYIGKSTVLSGIYSYNIRFNNDTGTNYSCHHVYGQNGSAVSATGLSSQSSITTNASLIPSSAASYANTHGVGIIDILDYTSTSKAKTLVSMSGVDVNASTVGEYIDLYSGLWFATPTAITSISFILNSGNWTTSSSFALYGVS